jgi:glutathione S-transferase
MNAATIAEYLESTYPSPALPLTSPLGAEVEYKARNGIGSALRAAILPREIHILSPGAQEYFRRTREASLGRPIESLLEEEEAGWKAVEPTLSEISPLLLTNKERGPFLLGEQVSYTDFFTAGYLQFLRVVDEGIFDRFSKFSGFRAIYDACTPYMDKKD